MLYYLSLMGFVILFSVFGLFFLPVFGGCFGLIIFFTVLIAFIVFFSLNFIWFLFAAVVIYIIKLMSKYSTWVKLPDQNRYMQEHADCVREHGVNCYSCGSTEVHNRGLIWNNGKMRYYQCAVCRLKLFKSKVL